MECNSYKYQVQPREVDFTKRATIISLGDYLLHAAGEDADKIGFGMRTMHSKNMAWVLSRMAIEVDRYPNEYEYYRIATWVGEIGRMMTTRNFIIYDMKDQVIGRATTLWAMIDMNTRQPLDLRQNVNYANALREIPAPLDKPLRIGTVTGDQVEPHKIRYSDIDFNRHTNSMKYVQWMVDMLPLEQITSGKLRRLDMNFTHETRYGDEVTIHLQQKEKLSLFEVRTSEDVAACKASLNWI